VLGPDPGARLAGHAPEAFDQLIDGGRPARSGHRFVGMDGGALLAPL